MTALEFICAQAPLRLKGLLIGIWYASLSVNYLLAQAPEIYITDSNTWEVFQEVKAFLIALSLILFAYVSRQYRYRVRDEVVNEQFLVEEIYERELIIAAQLEEEDNEKEALLYNFLQSIQYKQLSIRKQQLKNICEIEIFLFAILAEVNFNMCICTKLIASTCTTLCE